MAKWTDASLPRFLLVGVGNTLLSAAILFLLVNLTPVGPALASAVAYLAGAVMSFFLNRFFTFHSREGFWASALKFAVNVAVLWALCYLLVQPPLSGCLAGHMGEKWAENLSLLLCMGLYTGLNYLGQRFFAFRPSGYHR